jgi:hypothetical protein
VDHADDHAVTTMASKGARSGPGRHRTANRRSRRHPVLAAVVVLGLFTAASCSRSDDSPEEATEETPSEDGGGSEGGGGGEGLDAGAFGDLGTVCLDGDASGATDVGVTDDEIRVGTVTDKGFQVRAGLTKEMYDTAVAFATWCNEHGGINGREVVVDDLDAQGPNYNLRIGEACGQDFALVGGGAVFDNNDNGQRVSCGLPNVAGYVVNAEARAAELQVQPLPNPLVEWPVQQYRTMRELYPDATNFGVLWVDFSGVTTVHQQVVEAVEGLGYDVVYDSTYAPIGETGWRNFVQQMRDNDVQVFELIGEPENFSDLLNAMEAEGWYPEAIVAQPNMYEARIEEEAAGSAGQNIYVRTTFPTYDMAEDNQAVADYLQLMEDYGEGDARYPALLGMQALSSYLLFAQAATECGSELTRTCLMETALGIDEWTAGGLHATTNPGNLEAARCGVMIRFGEDGYVYDEEATAPNEGIYNCSEDNVFPLTGDFGVEAPEE